MQKECPEDKILNPATNRCVSRTGAIGKKLLKASVPAPAPIPAPTPARRPISMGMTREEPVIQTPPATPRQRRLTARRPASLSVPVYQPPSTPFITPGSSVATTINTANTAYSSIPSASSYASIASVASTPRGDEIFYDAQDYTNNMINASRIIQKAVRKNLPKFYDVPEIPEEDKYYTAPQYTKKEQKEMKKKKKMTRAFIGDINKIQSTPEYMKGLFDKPISLPGSKTDMLEGIAYINKAIKEVNKEVNKPKIKRTNKRNMI